MNVRVLAFVGFICGLFARTTAHGELRVQTVLKNQGETPLMSLLDGWHAPTPNVLTANHARSSPWGIVRVSDSSSDGRVDSRANRVFSDTHQTAWYYFFWTGSCEKFSIVQWAGCGAVKGPVKNENGGREYTGYRDLINLVVDGRADLFPLREELLNQGAELAEEWAKDNDVRCIDTDRLKSWFRYINTRLNETLDAAQRAKDIFSHIKEQMLEAYSAPTCRTPAPMSLVQ